MNGLQERIEVAYSASQVDESARSLVDELKRRLNAGEVRAAHKQDGKWQVNPWVKKGILLGFRLGEMVDYSVNESFRFYDKSTYPLKRFGLADRVRQVPGGSAIRDGTYVAPGVVIMPPAYINVGAYVGEGTMIDSHALVGSCAQIGAHVHLSAGAQIGGVLEPVGSMPVIIEDHVLVGGNCGVFDGTRVCEHAVIAAGTVLTASTPVFDLVKEDILRKTDTSPLVIPPGAVVVQGSRLLPQPFAKEHGLSLNTPIIIKYRDEKTDAATALENFLR
ncbi:MAG: 2,3,4,5-tetrahydropyridine-2,6-dicarboxylate N-succinyltransferase [bacterium]